MANSHNSGRITIRSLFAFPWNVFVIAIAVAIILRVFVVQLFAIPTPSMQPTLQPGDRIVVEKFMKFSRGIQRGDIVVFDAADVWTAPGVTDEYVKRVIGVAGDRVVCCTADGRLSVNGQVFDEPYLAAKGKTRSFDVVVQPDRLWVLGDNREASADSSAFRGAPGGGTVPEDHVIGRVVAVIWPLDRAGILGTQSEGTQ